MPNCKQCATGFEIASADQEYYQKIEAPEPTLCPPCRAQRRKLWRNERNFYVSKSALTGKRLISSISPDKPFVVYSPEEWWSDAFDPLDYGRDFDFDRPFFDQFFDLFKKVPLMSLGGSDNENCDYCHLLANCKNCYMIVESSNNENCYYGFWLQKCLGCCEASYSHECQYCYEVDNAYNNYNLKWSTDCNNCSDSSFLKNCTGCKHCYGCVNLNHKEYHIFNEPRSEAQYKAFMEGLDFNSYKTVEDQKQKFQKFALKYPNKYAHIVNSENCTGDYIVNSRNCEMCFHAHDAENCKYGEHVWRASRNNMDVSTAGREGEWIYEAVNVGISSFNVHYSGQCWTCSDMRYCYGCNNSNHCFGCAGLKRHRYCIFNKQYTKAEYEALVPRIIAHMKKTGEWGEFFPMNLSPYCYNESAAQQEFPLTKNEALKKGFPWSDYQPPLPEAKKVISADALPDNNKDIPDDVLNWALKCVVTKKPFRLTAAELKFYRENNVPIPRKHPDQRYQERMALRNPNTLWPRACAKCGKAIQTTYSPDRPEIVYCEKCYLETVY